MIYKLQQCPSSRQSGLYWKLSCAATLPTSALKSVLCSQPFPHLFLWTHALWKVLFCVFNPSHPCSCGPKPYGKSYSVHSTPPLPTPVPVDPCPIESPIFCIFNPSPSHPCSCGPMPYKKPYSVYSTLPSHPCSCGPIPYGKSYPQCPPHHLGSNPG